MFVYVELTFGLERFCEISLNVVCVLLDATHFKTKL